jgi:hypothetical protein
MNINGSVHERICKFIMLKNLNEDKGFSFLKNGVVTCVNRYGVATECA